MNYGATRSYASRQRNEQRFGQRPGQRFGGQRSGGQRRFSANGGRKTKSFDPTFFMKRAVIDEAPQAAFVPVNSFMDFPLSEQLQKNIIARGYIQPTQIQDQAIPQLLTGRDVVGLANTGTGKTAAFLIPLIEKVFKDRSQKVLIMVPTRELAVQIEEEFKQFAMGMKIFSVICIGGTNIRAQMYRLQRNPHFVIGTPGRLRDLENQGSLNFADYATIVLDEVDQMLDMGFISDIKYVASRLPRQRHSLFFSATALPGVQGIMAELLHNPIKISVKSRDTSANIDQDVVRLNGREKIEVLHELLMKEEFEKVLVFSRTKHGAESLARSLDMKRVRVASIHGNKTQSQRQRAIEMFKRNQVKVLIATDVASRGLDIDNVSHVINYDLPETMEAYIHRIGRTGRADKKGIALTFI